MTHKMTLRFLAETMINEMPEEGAFLVSKNQSEIEIGPVCLDSRNLIDNCLFIPLKGDKYDAHDYLIDCLKRNAGAAFCNASDRIVPQIKALKIKKPVLFVRDTLSAFRTLAQTWRLNFQIPVIAIGGSVGKTTTKELLSSIFATRFSSLVVTAGSENGFVGIPKTLMQITAKHQAAIIEIGIDAIGAMKQHAEVSEPTAALLTAIEPEHMEFLKDIETVAREELVLLHYLNKRGRLICVNADDSLIFSDFAHSQEPWFYGLENLDIKKKKNYVLGKISGESIALQTSVGHFKLPFVLPGEHNAANIVAAACMAISHGFSQEEIIHGLTQFKPAFGRTQIETLRSGTIFLKDYYNASPASMKAALKLGREIANKEQKKLFLCLGDMLELGEEEKKYHRDLALDIQKVNPNLVLLFGSRTKLTNEELTAHGAKNVMNFATHEELANKLQTQLNGNEVVLIKGSRSMKMEKILSHLSPSVITNEVK